MRMRERERRESASRNGASPELRMRTERLKTEREWMSAVGQNVLQECVCVYVRV